MRIILRVKNWHEIIRFKKKNDIREIIHAFQLKFFMNVHIIFLEVILIMSPVGSVKNTPIAYSTEV